MARILLLSNGHGEDVSGALIGKALKKVGHVVHAIPFVGHGISYSDVGIRILGYTREFSTGGLGYTSLRGRLTELIQGQGLYLAWRFFYLFRVVRKYDLLVVIGDVVPVFAAWLTGSPFTVYLVAYSSHYEGQLRLPWPCATCLVSKKVLGIYSRDQLTANDLSSQLGRPVRFLGNPFMDPVLTPRPRLSIVAQRLGLLPGSRRPELDTNILLLLRVVERLPEKLFSSGSFSVDLALVSTLDFDSLETLLYTSGWEVQMPRFDNTSRLLVRGVRTVKVHRDSFEAVLQSSDIFLCMAGTAAEQAVGLAKPVVQLIGKGPQFTSSFAEAQRRLLGPTIFSAKGKLGSDITFLNTASLILQLLERIKNDPVFQKECEHQAKDRLGLEGGGQLIASEISNLINHPT